MFGRFAVEAIAPEQRKEFFSLADKFAAPALFHNGCGPSTTSGCDWSR